MIRSGFAAVAGLALTACVSDAARDYAARHPGWVRDFPREAIRFDELMASLVVGNPAPGTLAQVTRQRVIGLGTQPWEVIPEGRFETPGFRPDPGRLYVVAVNVECFWSVRREGLLRDSFSWYVFRDERLVAYRHTEYAEYCEEERLIHGSAHGVEGFEERVHDYLVHGADAAKDTP